ncbi:MAG: type II secretion system ATPase GspE [bacterium]
MVTRKPLGEILKSEKMISDIQLKEALKESKKRNLPIGETLLQLGLITEEGLLSALSNQLGIPCIKISDDILDPSLINQIPARLVYDHKFFPIKQSNNTITLATSDPLDIYILDNIRLILGKEVEWAIASEQDITSAIKRYYGLGAETVEGMMGARDETLEVIRSEEEPTELEDMAKDVSIIKFVNQIILEAHRMRATDIHIEPYEKELRIRYRIDGVLHEISTHQSIKLFQPAIVSRIKIMADLNIAEHRLPQDGRMKLRIKGEELDIRVSTLPTPSGESVVLRLLTRASILFGLEHLGMQPYTLRRFDSMIKRPHGIILVTGPTGSGKTTTLYAAISKINTINDNIITIEDPIEYRLPGINQIQIKPKIGFSFATGLRHILRHDPDIIMVGEIRDLETAEIAIQASLTGHLVFSTLHTNDAAGAVTRLIDMGIEPYLIASSVEGILAQRLVRVICPECKEPYLPDPVSLEETQPGKALYRGKGCKQCLSTGYYGRTGIFEFLLIDDEIRKLILSRTPTKIIKEQARNLGMKTLREDGWEKVAQGRTTIEEVLRVTEVEVDVE